MKYTVVFRKEARDEAIQAAAYIAEQGAPDAALRWYQGLEETINSLAEMPARCSYARENELFPDTELRQFVYHSHRLIFTIRGDQVHVLHVRHAAREALDTL